jgi:lipid A 3-O-deacylase
MMGRGISLFVFKKSFVMAVVVLSAASFAIGQSVPAQGNPLPDSDDVSVKADASASGSDNTLTGFDKFQSDMEKLAECAKRKNVRWTASLMHENDMFANTDCDYTTGSKLSFVSPDLTDFREAGVFPDSIYKFSDYLPFIHEQSIQRNIVINVGQNMYTPEDTAAKNPDPTDRPYCGWLYMGVAFHNKTERWLDIIEVNMGVIGTWSLAHEAQDFVHRNIRHCDVSYGWDHQIGNEPVVNIVWERKLRYWRLGDAYGPAADAIAHLGGSLGTLYTYANTGFTLRCGWNLPKDFGTTTIRIAGDVNAPASNDDPRIREDSRWGIHFFGDIDGRAVARDGTLDGDLFSDSVSVDKLPFVMDLSTGSSIMIGSWKLSYAQVYRTKEFKTQKTDHHVFGSVTISFTY